MDREKILGEINTNSQNRHGLPLPDELMRERNSHRGTGLQIAAMGLFRDGEVPFMVRPHKRTAVRRQQELSCSCNRYAHRISDIQTL